LLFAAPAIGFAWWRRRRPIEAFFDVPGKQLDFWEKKGVEDYGHSSCCCFGFLLPV